MLKSIDMSSHSKASLMQGHQLSTLRGMSSMFVSKGTQLRGRFRKGSLEGEFHLPVLAMAARIPPTPTGTTSNGESRAGTS